jgi:hypothetical protein
MADAPRCERCLALWRLHTEAVADQRILAGRLLVTKFESPEEVTFLKARMKSALALRELVESQIRQHEIEEHSRSVPAMSE